MNGKKLLKDKERKVKLPKIGKLQKDCDTRMQQIGTQLNPKCEVCGKPVSCMHHFFPKSVSSALRYDWDNLIPICNGCHNRHHQANDPRIHETIRQKRGGDVWYERLLRKKYIDVRVNREYYATVMEKLENHLLRKS